MKIITLLSLLITLVSCKTYNENDKAKFDNTIQKFIAKSDTKFEKSESGLYYFIEQEGVGRCIKLTDEVSFIYEGKFLNGKVFDGKFKHNPVTFSVTKLIEGWKEAMFYLKKGGKAKLIVPPYLGYADYDLEAIPKHSILYFEIEIKDVR